MTELTKAQIAARKAAETRRRNREAREAALTAQASSALPQLVIRCGDEYRDATAAEILDVAARLMTEERRGTTIRTTEEAARLLRPHVAGRPAESFAVMFLDCRLQVIEIEVMFRGTVDQASVYVREVVRRALELNASRMIVAHNHPSGQPDPSAADVAITKKLAQALRLIDVQLLDHVICTNVDHVSLAARGVL